MISQNKIDEILARADLVDIASEYVKLKKASTSYIGLCPFHHEKTPSFHISRQKQLYHCFGCGASGNVITFIKNIKNVTFYEALKELANRYNIELEETNLLPKYQKNKELFQINEIALTFFKKNLFSPNGNTALNYLMNRKLTQETLVLFKIGFAPEGWDNLKNELLRNGVDLKLAHNLGLLSYNEEKKSYYDKYRNRIIFPIVSLSGQVIGFGGRTISNNSNEAKYINSAESDIYHKRKTLFGLYHSQNSIKEMDRAILVEGYIDYLTLFQHGITNVIASSGTALTDDQVSLISRFTKNIYIVYDADTAGQKATDRSIEIFLQQGFNIHIVTLPDDEDPDTFIIKYGKTKFRELLDNSENFIDYKYRTMINDPNNVFQQKDAVVSIINLISKIEDPILQNLYLKNLSKKFNLNYNLLQKELEKNNISKNTEPKTTSDYDTPTYSQGNYLNFEKELLSVLLQFDKSSKEYILRNIDLNFFTTPETIAIAEILFSDENITSVAYIYELLEDDNAKKILIELSEKNTFNDKNQLWLYTFNLIKKIQIIKISEDINDLKNSGNINESIILTIQKLLKEKKNLENQIFDPKNFLTVEGE
ncbi:MAG TPA: DNA primase [Ignavibacteriales bacterium]|nr:DNA primase [Ignavibacteriales bacterium]